MESSAWQPEVAAGGMSNGWNTNYPCALKVGFFPSVRGSLIPGDE